MVKDQGQTRSELLPGTLEMLVLKTLTRGPMHGYGIAQYVGQTSDEVLQIEEGSLYPALQRLTLDGYIKRTPLSTFRAQHRGGKGRAGMTTKEEDAVSEMFVTST